MKSALMTEHSRKCSDDRSFQLLETDDQNPLDQFESKDDCNYGTKQFESKDFELQTHKRDFSSLVIRSIGSYPANNSSPSAQKKCTSPELISVLDHNDNILLLEESEMTVPRNDISKALFVEENANELLSKTNFKDFDNITFQQSEENVNKHDKELIESKCEESCMEYFNINTASSQFQI